MQISAKTIKEAAIKNKYLIILFLLSTIFFVFQHYFNFSWDFATYVDNARYLTGQGSYFEILRPPLVPFILAVFSSGVASEYIFIALVSLLFLYSTIKLADLLRINRALFYLFSLSPYVLFFGLINGTELLSLALLELFLVHITAKSKYSGFFLGLACLARYNFIIFIPLLLLDKNIKKIAGNLALFLATFAPWLAYNFYSTGNLFTSLANNYALNIKYRYYIMQPINLTDIAGFAAFLLPLFAIGLISFAKKAKISKKFLDSEKLPILFLVISALTIYQFIFTPIKETRYLFPLALPVAYFSTIGFNKLIKYKRKAIIIASILVVLNLLYFASIGISANYDNQGRYTKPIAVLHDTGKDNCKTLSNVWPLLNYIGKTTEPFPRKELVQSSINEGDFIVMFYSTPDPQWATREFLRNFTSVYEDDQFIILGNATQCNPERKADQTYIEMLHKKIFRVYNVSINTNPCFVLFSNELLERSCNLINGKGFTKDENRITGLEFVRD